MLAAHATRAPVLTGFIFGLDSGKEDGGQAEKAVWGGGERRFEGGRGRMILETSWHNFVLVALHCFWSLECTTFGKKVSYFGLVAEISRNGRV